MTPTPRAKLVSQHVETDGAARPWSAVTRHRFSRLADLSAEQSRDQRLAEKPGRLSAFDGDQSPPKSAAKSAHSKACGGTSRI